MLYVCYHYEQVILHNIFMKQFQGYPQNQPDAKPTCNYSIIFLLLVTKDFDLEHTETTSFPFQFSKQRKSCKLFC